MDKAKLQLGMNPSTARNRLLRDLVAKLLRERKETCYRCDKPLNSDWTVDHKINWLDSDDPVGLFFDVDNVAFSHHSCNSGASRTPMKKYDSPTACKRAWKQSNYSPAKRHEQYLKHGH